MAEDFNNSGNESWQVVGGTEQDKVDLRMKLASKPVPTAEALRAEASGSTTWGIILLVIGVIMFIVSSSGGGELVVFGVIPLKWVAAVFGVILLFMGHDQKKTSNSKGILSLSRNGSSVECRWNAAPNMKYCLAVDSRWVDADVSSPYTLRDVPENALITLATWSPDGNGNPDYAGADRA